MDQPDNTPDAETGDDTRPDAPAPKPKFTEWLAAHRGGVLDVDFAEAFSDVVDAVVMTGKPGTVSLTLKVNKAGEMISVIDEIKAKIPEQAEPRLYWRGLDGTLQRDNPLQPQMLRHPEGD